MNKYDGRLGVYNEATHTTKHVRSPVELIVKILDHANDFNIPLGGSNQPAAVSMPSAPEAPCKNMRQQWYKNIFDFPTTQSGMARYD